MAGNPNTFSSVSEEARQLYWKLRGEGMSITRAAKVAQFSRATAIRYEHGTSSLGADSKAIYLRENLPDVIPAEKLKPEARRALDDFAYFRRRYFGRIASPWQEQAANQIKDLLDTPQKEYVVINCPPGAGKSTLFTHDIPAWLACRNRAIRCLIGSRTERQAKQYTNRLRTTFDRRTPMMSDSEKIAKGAALNAESTLVADFGRFKPLSADLWRSNEFVIAQPGG